mgnify:CR=1 FL=1
MIYWDVCLFESQRKGELAQNQREKIKSMKKIFVIGG